jgi:hypothetical protein
MSVKESGVVDAIGVEKGSDAVVLTISDHLEWDHDNEHLLTLQDKINRHLAFIESGELLEKYPDAAGRPVRIDVVCKYAPSETALTFFSRAEAAIRDAGFSFGWRVLAA